MGFRPGAASLAHLHFDVRFLVQAEHDRFRVNDESHALAWVPKKRFVVWLESCDACEYSGEIGVLGTQDLFTTRRSRDSVIGIT